MKRLLLVLCGVIFLCTACPASFAQGPRGAGSERHHRKFNLKWFHRQPHHEKTPPLHTVPKSVGWWHHRNPGPAGAGVK
jgi:hypothetical protein